MEFLEDRTLLSGSTLLAAAESPLAFASQRATAAGFLQAAQDVQIYRANLNVGDVVSVAVDAQAIGSGLNSTLRIFDSNGAQLAANDDFAGTDSRVTFQAAASGAYYFGVSAAGNANYDATVVPDLDTSSVLSGATFGAFQLTVTVQTGQTPTTDVTAAAFALAQNVTVPGETVGYSYRIENRGGLAAGAFSVRVLLSTDNRFSSPTVLDTIAYTDLAAGGAAADTKTVALPAGLTPGAYFIGIEIIPAAGINAASNLSFNQHAVRGTGWDTVNVLTPYTSTPAATLAEATGASAPPSLLNGYTTAKSISTGSKHFYTVTVGAAGLLSTHVAASSGQVLLTLRLPSGALLAQSATGAIEQHVAAGVYILEVTPLTASAQYRLAAAFTAASDPLSNVALTAKPSLLVHGDFNGDGLIDLATADSSGVVVLPGLGDGSFGNAVATNVSGTIKSLLAADFNNDGVADLAALTDNGTVNILLGAGDGAFTAGDTLALAGVTEPLVAVGDFTNDARLDVVLGGAGVVHVYVGAGNGAFVESGAGQAVAGTFSGPIVAGDFNGDGRLDLTTASGTVLLGGGDGSFIQAGDRPVAANNPAGGIVVADFNGDGRADLAEFPSIFSGSLGKPILGKVKLSFGDGAGGFAAPLEMTVPGFQEQIVAADVNNDGRWDLLYRTSTALAVLLNIDAPTGSPFAEAVTFSLPLAAQAKASAFVAADFNGDGRIDAAVGAGDPGSVAVFRGGGDGTLRTNTQILLHNGTVMLVTGDFTADGRADLAAANKASNDLTVSLSDGAGFFLDGGSLRFPTNNGLPPSQLVSGDFNGDGRLDLAAFYRFEGPFFPSFDPVTQMATGYVGTIAVFLGVGDGSFQLTTSIDVLMPTNDPGLLFAADFNGDGSTDLVIGRAVFRASVTGQGLSFIAPATFLSSNVRAVGEFTGDAFADVIVDVGATEVVLRGLGNGTFSTAVYVIPVSGDMQIGDFDGDGKQDVAVLHNNQVSAYRGNGDGTFTLYGSVALQTPNLGARLAVGDFNGDGKSDLAVAYQQTNGAGGPGGDHVTAYLNNGSGAFIEVVQSLPVEPSPIAVVAADFNGDGRLDLATASSIGGFTEGRLTILLGRGDGTFFDPTRAAEAAERALPLLADLDGGPDDLIIVDQSGAILFRTGLADGSFGAPIIVNPDHAARDVAVVVDEVAGTVQIAAVDFGSAAISLYTLTNGVFDRSAGPATGVLPTRIASADLNGDGRGDLVVINSGSDTLAVFLNTGSGFVAQTLALTAGASPLDVQLAKVDADDDIDVVVANGVSGDVSILLNGGAGTFGTELRFRADSGPYSLTTSGAVSAASRTAGLAVGDFNGDHVIDVIAVNRDAGTFSLLTGLGDGVLANPRVFLAGSQPSSAAVGHFNDDDDLDVAVLNEGDSTVSIFLGDGAGGFTHGFTAGAGNSPAGLAVADVDGADGLDLIVGNAFGDVLVLLGNGDGTFNPYQRLDQRVSLAVLGQSGGDAVILGNLSQDRVSMQDAQGANAPLLDRLNDLLGPKVQQGDVNNDGYDDLIVVNSGGNTVDVYLGTADGDFIDIGMHKPFFVGTNPSSILVTEVNDDLIPDLVVTNAGSNDVSILFGTGVVNGDGSIANWSAKIGPRLSVGSSPESVVLQDVVRVDALSQQIVAGPDGVADLVVSNERSNDVWTIAGVGDGFFRDNSPLITSDVSGIIITAGTGAGAFLVNQTTGVVTFVPDLAAPTVRSVVAGASGVGGIGGDFNSDGVTDALVLSADGIVDLIFGDIDGATIAASLDTGLDDPSELAFSSDQTGLFSFYVSYVNAENVEAAVQFALDLGALDSSSETVININLASVDDSALAFIAVLVAGNADAAAAADAVAPSALTDALLGLDSHNAGSEAEVSPSELARLTNKLRQSWEQAAGQLKADLAEIARLMRQVWAEFRAGLALDGRDVLLDHLQNVLVRSALEPLQQAAQTVGASLVQAAQAAAHAVSHTLQPGVPITASPRLEHAPLPTAEADLDLAFALWGAPEPLPELAAVLAETSPWSGVLPSALLTAGLATGCWLAGDRQRASEKLHASRS